MSIENMSKENSIEKVLNAPHVNILNKPVFSHAISDLPLLHDCPAFREMWLAIPEEARKYCKLATSKSPNFVKKFAPGFMITAFGGILFECPEKEVCFDENPEVGYLYRAYNPDSWKWTWNPEFKAGINEKG